METKKSSSRRSRTPSPRKMSKMVIHISGPSGAGKTTLGNKIQKKFGKKIVVKDVDNLRSEYIESKYQNNFNWKKFDSEDYQLFLDDYILKQTKPLVLVGLNHMFWHDKYLYYDLHSDYNFYIDIDDMQVVKQKCIRFITDELQDMMKNDNILNDIVNDNKKFVKLITENIERECGTKETFKLNKMWNKDYKKQGYTILSSDDIYNEVAKILENIL